jgi:Zn-dependent peptidase ImmA (M78 family)
MLSTKRQEELSNLAEFVAESYCPSNLIEPRIIADASGITYSYGNYENYFDGMLQHQFGKFHIFINIDKAGHSYSPRARFTFAHELGHYFIDEHRLALESGETPSHPSFTNFSSKNPVEVEADFFAASLLMPKSRVIKDCFRRKFNFQIIEELSAKYQTSITATLMKFASIGNHPIMVICSVGNKVKWAKFSDDFPYKRIKQLKNATVPPDSIAGEYFQSNKKYNTEIQVAAIDWFENVWDADVERPFYEKCIYADNHNFVLSILWED